MQDRIYDRAELEQKRLTAKDSPGREEDRDERLQSR